jgi:dethiobiotin synthetase
MARGLFVAGTDTGVGKTLVACAIVRLLRERSVDAVGFKAVVTGQEDGKWADAEALHQASEGAEPLEILCPIRLRAPLAPVPAAKEEGATLHLDLARAAWRDLHARHSVVIVEGIGGLLVPLDEKVLQLDFIAELKLPVLLVARAGLGTINHTLLSLRELRRAQVPVAGLILNVTRAEDAANVQHSLPEILRFAGGMVPTVVPHFPEDGPLKERINWVAFMLRDGLDVMGLMG